MKRAYLTKQDVSKSHFLNSYSDGESKPSTICASRKNGATVFANETLRRIVISPSTRDRHVAEQTGRL